MAWIVITSMNVRFKKLVNHLMVLVNLYRKSKHYTVQHKSTSLHLRPYFFLYKLILIFQYECLRFVRLFSTRKILKEKKRWKLSTHVIYAPTKVYFCKNICKNYMSFYGTLLILLLLLSQLDKSKSLRIEWSRNKEVSFLYLGSLSFEDGTWNK